MQVNLMHGDCRALLKTLPDNSVDSIVTDPPYGLKFMARKWDYSVPDTSVWRECLRVLKPGGYLLAFAGTRTQHRMAVNIEDAGFEIKDMIAWVYGSGWPKGQNIAKAIDKVLGFDPVVIGENPNSIGRKRNKSNIAGTGGEYGKDDAPREAYLTTPVSVEAKQWEGWNTALKPALEPITMARKPNKGTIAKNVLHYGTGALNIGACQALNESNRYPANLIHDGSDEVVELFPSNAGASAPVKGSEPSNVHNSVYGAMNRGKGVFYDDSGSAARFFYCAKASKSDRTNNGMVENKHVTVKPFDLMRYLCRLVTPPGGVILDPFMGSGSTGKAALAEGFGFIGIEMEDESYETAVARIPAKAREAC